MKFKFNIWGKVNNYNRVQNSISNAVYLMKNIAESVPSVSSFLDLTLYPSGKTQPVITYSKVTTEALEQGVKYVQS